MGIVLGKKGLCPGKERGKTGGMDSRICLGHKRQDKRPSVPTADKTPAPALPAPECLDIVEPLDVHHGQTGEVGYQSSPAFSLPVGALIQCDKPLHQQ